MALLLLSCASVTSIVMQTAMASPVGAEPPAGDAGRAMAGMSMPDAQPTQANAAGSAHLAKASLAKTDPAKPGHARSAACPYCAVAGHLPVLGGVTPFQPPTAFSFAAFRAVAGRGPRGPPSFEPHARGPPSDPLSL